jgi:hypothetical protein
MLAERGQLECCNSALRKVTLLDVLELRETPFGDCGTGIEPQIQLLIAQDLVDQEKQTTDKTG